MWPDRFTVYYSPEKAYAVRWLDHGRPESEAQFKRFDDEGDAERFYRELVDRQGDEPARIELFFSQTKWLCYRANGDESGFDTKQVT